jgi:hypothetical protein
LHEVQSAILEVTSTALGCTQSTEQNSKDSPQCSVSHYACHCFRLTQEQQPSKPTLFTSMCPACQFTAVQQSTKSALISHACQLSGRTQYSNRHSLHCSVSDGCHCSWLLLVTRQSTQHSLHCSISQLPLLLATPIRVVSTACIAQFVTVATAPACTRQSGQHSLHCSVCHSCHCCRLHHWQTEQPAQPAQPALFSLSRLPLLLPASDRAVSTVCIAQSVTVSHSCYCSLLHQTKQSAQSTCGVGLNSLVGHSGSRQHYLHNLPLHINCILAWW